MSLTPRQVLHAYTLGAFPMAQGREAGSAIDWYTADPRALLPVDGRLRVRRSLAKVIRRGDFTVTMDRAFDQVVSACAQPRQGEEGTWISEDLRRVYQELFEMGLAHSVETWREEAGALHLVGGLYGVALGAVFFGESMFSRKPFASQVALVRLVDHLRARGFELLDVQFVNRHLEQFGVETIAAADYLDRLRRAVDQPPHW